jgi:hypothetical protein
VAVQTIRNFASGQQAIGLEHARQLGAVLGLDLVIRWKKARRPKRQPDVAQCHTK